MILLLHLYLDTGSLVMWIREQREEFLNSSDITVQLPRDRRLVLQNNNKLTGVNVIENGVHPYILGTMV